MPTTRDAPSRHGPSAVLAARDPAHGVLHRALRVTLAAGIGFYLARYAFDAPVVALYATFGAIAAGALSEVVGTPAQRTRGYAGALVAALVLVTVGTLVAGSTVAASVTMLAVGFAIAYAAAAGPRIAAVGNGLQLFYVLPCFPPFAPDQLDDRLLGVALGLVLLAVLDRVLWPAPGPPDVAPRVATAAERVAAYATALAGALRAGSAPDPGALAAARRAAVEAAHGIRMSGLDMAQRPLGCGLRDRSVLATCAAVRLQAGRLAGMDDRYAAMPHGPHPATAALLDAAGATLAGVAATLRGQAAPPAVDDVDAALAGWRARRAALLPGGDGPDLRTGLSGATIADTARLAARAVEGVVRGSRGRTAPPPDLQPDLWFLHAGPVALLLHRLRVHLTPRSVYLQNAVRIAVGLTAARVVAGVFDLSHGFWVLLATLSLMRTSAVAGRAVMVRAFLGTIGGAVVAAGLLYTVGRDDTVYAWLMPFLMVLAFVAGPLFGVAAGQAGFTVVVAVLFAQVAPATWQLAELRVLDVVVGGVVGAVIGAAIWPRGGGGELRRVGADSLRSGADEVVATVAALTGHPPPDDPQPRLTRLSALFDHTYIQYRTEPSTPGAQVDWLTVVATVHRLAGYAAALRDRHPTPAPLPWPDDAEPLRAMAGEVAGGLRTVAGAAAAGNSVPAGTVEALHARFHVTLPANLSDAPADALRLLDVWGWLAGLVDDVGRLRTALDPDPRPGGPATQERSAGERPHVGGPGGDHGAVPAHRHNGQRSYAAVITARARVWVNSRKPR